jgi:hypothetical protein
MNRSLAHNPRMFRYSRHDAPRAGLPMGFATKAFAIALLAACLPGCAPSALTAARSHIAAGNYAAARHELVTLDAHSKTLSAGERREVKDDLCLSDFMLGQPSFTLAEQRRVCAVAMQEPGSQSGGIVARIDDEMRNRDARAVEAALEADDLASAERAAIDYQNAPGADPALVARWSKQIWHLADEQVFADESAKERSFAAAIAQARKNYPKAQHMNAGEFSRWITETATISGTPMASRVDVNDATLRLSVDNSNLQLASRNLDRLTSINDAFVARCGCDAHTNVAVSETGFPAYVIRLDPETKMSEVMILPRGDRAIVSASFN